MPLLNKGTTLKNVTGLGFRPISVTFAQILNKKLSDRELRGLKILLSFAGLFVRIMGCRGAGDPKRHSGGSGYGGLP